jgi:hypothetical protein
MIRSMSGKDIPTNRSGSGTVTADILFVSRQNYGETRTITFQCRIITPATIIIVTVFLTSDGKKDHNDMTVRCFDRYVFHCHYEKPFPSGRFL